MVYKMAITNDLFLTLEHFRSNKEQSKEKVEEANIVLGTGIHYSLSKGRHKKQKLVNDPSPPPSLF